MFEELQGKVLITINDSWQAYKADPKDRKTLVFGDYARWDADHELHKILLVNDHNIWTHCTKAHGAGTVICYTSNVFDIKCSSWTYIPRNVVEGPFEEKLPDRLLTRFELIDL